MDWLKNYAMGYLRLMTQTWGWVTTYTWSTSMDTSTALWYKQGEGKFHEMYARLVNGFFRKVFRQEDHIGLSAWKAIAECRRFLEHPLVGHIVLNKEQAAEYRQIMAERHKAAPKKSAPEQASKVAEPPKAPKANGWVWSADDYYAWITSPKTFDEKLDFFTSIKEGGFNPQGVTGMDRDEYDHWSEMARTHASQWIMNNATPKPRANHGMTE